MSATTVKIRNVGPKSAAWLRQVGIKTDDEVKAIGALETFMKVKRAGFKPSLNLLYALEGAVLDCHWTALTVERKSELVRQLQDQGRKVLAGASRPGVPGQVGRGF